MWMCEGCQEINDDSAGICPHCGRNRTADFAPAAAPRTQLPTAVQELPSTVGEPLLSDQYENPDLQSSELSAELARSPALYAWFGGVILADVAALVGISTAMHGTSEMFVIATVMGGVLLCVGIAQIWKQIDLSSHSAQCQGKVVSVSMNDDQYDYNRRHDRYWRTVVGYAAGQREIQIVITSRWAFGPPHYDGEIVTVWYDPDAPEIATIAGLALYPPLWLLFGAGRSLLSTVGN